MESIAAESATVPGCRPASLKTAVAPFRGVGALPSSLGKKGVHASSSNLNGFGGNSKPGKDTCQSINLLANDHYRGLSVRENKLTLGECSRLVQNVA